MKRAVFSYKGFFEGYPSIYKNAIFKKLPECKTQPFNVKSYILCR